MTTLSLRAAAVDIRQDAADDTTIDVLVVNADGSAYDLSAGTYTDVETLWTVDDTDAADGHLVLTTTGQDVGSYPFTIRDTANEITWLTGYLIVGDIGPSTQSTRSDTITLIVSDGAITVEAVTPLGAEVLRSDGTPQVGDLLIVKSLDPIVIEALDAGTYTPGSHLLIPALIVPLPSSTASTVAVSGAATNLAQSERYQSGAAADADHYEWDVHLAAGTWTITTYWQKATNRAFYVVSVDGVDVSAGFDGYMGAAAVGIHDDAGVVIASTGIHRIKLRASGKNASSSGYFVQYHALALTKTA